MTIITVDLNDDTEVLRAAVEQIGVELNRRDALVEAEQLAEQANTIWEDATGRQDGNPWVQPTAAYNAYRLGALVTDEGKLWESTVSGNVWKPGVSGWREVVEEGDYPDFVQPTGAHDAYNKDDVVRFEGELFKSNMDGNVWSPADYPAGWELFTP